MRKTIIQAEKAMIILPSQPVSDEIDKISIGEREVNERGIVLVS